MSGLNAITTFVSPVLGADGPIGHTLDKELFGTSGLFAITMHTLTLLVAFVLMMFFMMMIVQRIKVGPESEGNARYVTKGRLAQMTEVVVIMLRDMFIKPQLGEDTNKYLPFLLTLFFFILFNNLLGLIPLLDLQHLIGLAWGDPGFAIIGGTPTGRIGVNAALALVCFLLWNIHGIIQNGVGGWLAHFLGGAPLYLAPIMIPVEIIGAIVKPVALTIRLFANMTAGHVLLAAILGFAPLAVDELGWIAGGGIGFVSMIAGVVIYFLELFVAFLQAFVFMFLATVFIAQMGHHEHDDHAHEHGEGEAIPDGAVLGAA